MLRTSSLAKVQIQPKTKPKNNPSPNIKPQITPKNKIRLFNLIRAEKQLDMTKTSKSLHIAEAKIKDMLYDLMGKGHIEGLFQGSVFVIKSNIDDFT